MNWVARLVTLLCCLVSVSSIWAQSPTLPRDIAEVGRQSLRVYTDKDGLPNNSISAIAFDQRGYLWIGTLDGLACYNGQRWQTYNLPNATLSNYVRAMLIATDGSIWIARQDGGIAVLKDNNWTTYEKSNGLPDNRVRCLFESRGKDGQSIIWAGTIGGGIGKFVDNRWTTLPLDPVTESNEIWSLRETVNKDGSRLLWVGTDRGLFTWLCQN